MTMRDVRRRWVLPCYVAGFAALLITVSLRAQSQRASSANRAHERAQPTLFTHSDNCVACHNNLATTTGEDVSIGTSWRSTIMAHSARDPYFLASVRRETIDYRGRSEEIQNDCAACHVPIAHKSASAVGRHAAILDRAYSADDDARRLEPDGVSCTVCHQIAADTLGTPESFNGNFRLHPARPDGVREIFGPFSVDKGRRTVMRSVTGFEQTEAAHVRQSELCATCHTLITQALDADGRVIGSLPEQMNYQEWRHSAFYDERRSCQSCHMPRAEGTVRVSSVLGKARDGLSRHTFVGGNAFMLRMLNRYRDLLNVDAPSHELEATAKRTEQQLRSDTATIRISTPQSVGGRFEFDVTVRNLTGHKFPTGYPSRRAWLHVTVRDGEGRPLFESGGVSADGAIRDNDADADQSAFERHHDVIERGDQVQIYESILGDASSRPTTGLLSALRYLKDNRLLPRGFDKTTADSQIAVVGDAAQDGTFIGGTDTVHYRLDGSALASPMRIDAVLMYQPIAYRWADNLGNYQSLETSRFLQFFTSMAPSSFSIVASASWSK
jgi:hypothetical protein